jgi:hypothetical protein
MFIIIRDVGRELALDADICLQILRDTGRLDEESARITSMRFGLDFLAVPEAAATNVRMDPPSVIAPAMAGMPSQARRGRMLEQTRDPSKSAKAPDRSRVLNSRPGRSVAGGTGKLATWRQGRSHLTNRW